MKLSSRKTLNVRATINQIATLPPFNDALRPAERSFLLVILAAGLTVIYERRGDDGNTRKDRDPGSGRTVGQGGEKPPGLPISEGVRECNAGVAVRLNIFSPLRGSVQEHTPSCLVCNQQHIKAMVMS